MPLIAPSRRATRLNRSPARPGWRRTRGVVVGVVCGVGGLVGHQLAGGAATALPAALAVAAAVLGGLALTRGDRTDPLRTVLLAIAGQVVCHAVLSTSPSAGGHDHDAGAMAGGGDAVAMVLLHAGVALVAAGVALGADRVLLRLARTLWAGLLPRLPRAVALPAPGRRRALVAAALAAVCPAERSGTPARGPPAPLRLRPLIPA